MSKPTEYHCEVVRTDALTDQDIADWRALCAKHSDYASPLLGPEFAQLAARRRNDVRVVLARKAGRLDAVLAVHLRPGGLARAVGSPFNDYAGPVFHPDAQLSLFNLLSMAKIACYRAQNVVDPHKKLEQSANLGIGDSWFIDLAGRRSAEVLETLRAEHPKRHKDFRRKTHKIERELGDAVLSWGQPVEADIAQLMAWKSAQYREERLVDITSTTYSAQVLQEAAATRTGPLQGFLLKLTVDGKLAAGHFGVRRNDIFHPWISAFDPRIGAYSPGILMLTLAIPAMEEMGLRIYDLSAGHEHYKKYFATHSRPIHDVCLSSATLAGKVRQFNRSAWALAGGNKATSLPARIGRNIEHVAASEAHFPARLSQFANAFIRRAIG